MGQNKIELNRMKRMDGIEANVAFDEFSELFRAWNFIIILF